MKLTKYNSITQNSTVRNVQAVPLAKFFRIFSLSRAFSLSGYNSGATALQKNILQVLICCRACFILVAPFVPDALYGSCGFECVTGKVPMYTNMVEYVALCLPGLGRAFLFSIPCCLYLAAVMLPFVVFSGLIWGQYSRRSLFERCSNQLAKFTNLLNWIFLISLVTSCACALLVQQAYSSNIIVHCGLYVGGPCLLAGTLVWAIIVRTWNKLRKVPSVHGLLILLAGICLVAVLLLCLLLWRACLELTLLPETATIREVLARAIPPFADPFWWNILLLPGQSAAAAGGFGLIWLILRRATDAYGRDYYAFAAHWCGKWAAWGGWISLVLFAGCQIFRMGENPAPSSAPAVFYSLCRFIPLLLATILWTVISRSPSPMRHKIEMTFAILLFVLSTAGNCILLL